MNIDIARRQSSFKSKSSKKNKENKTNQKFDGFVRFVEVQMFTWAWKGTEPFFQMTSEERF